MTNRPIVTATYERGLEFMGVVGGSTIHVQPGVTVEVTFPLHDHEAALAALDRAVADVWSQIDIKYEPARHEEIVALLTEIRDRLPERPVDEDGEAHSTVGNDPCVCLSEEPCRVHDDIGTNR